MKFQNKWLYLYFGLSVAVLIFVAGFWMGIRTPERTIDGVMRPIDDFIAYPKHNLRIAPEKQLVPVSDVFTELTVAKPGPEAYRGQTFVSGFFQNGPGLKLLDMDGRLLHEWKISYTRIWPDAKFLSTPIKHDWDSQIHGALLYPNGDVVFNFEYAGMVRMDRCSRVKWKLPLETNHSMFEDEQGHLWVPSRRERKKRVPRFQNIPAPFQEEYVLEVSPNGKVLREISVLDVIYGSKRESLLFANGLHNVSMARTEMGDFTHLNDVEVLSSTIAAEYPLFKAGDVMISLRNLNLVMVFDPATRRIKWATVGPFLRQHDPDFLPSGRISVFDNRKDSADGAARGGGRIVEIDPVTREFSTTFGGRPDQFFYTGNMGDHDQLPNGNMLVTGTGSGQVFEVTPEGKVVWSWVNHYDEKSVGWVERALRYPEGYMQRVGTAGCT